VAEVDERPRRAGGAAEDGEDEDPAEEEDEDVGGPDPGVHEPLRVPVQIRGRHRLHVQLRHRITLPPSLLLRAQLSPSAACCAAAVWEGDDGPPRRRFIRMMTGASAVPPWSERWRRKVQRWWRKSIARRAGGRATDGAREGERTGKAGGGEARARRLAAAGGRGDGGNATATATDRVKRDGRGAGRRC